MKLEGLYGEFDHVPTGILYTRVIKKIRGQCRSSSNYLSEIKNQYITFCKHVDEFNFVLVHKTGETQNLESFSEIKIDKRYTLKRFHL
jgi:hypothetical protein